MRARDDWDHENPEVHEAQGEVATVYRVSFSAGEIARIRAAARRVGVSTSEFIERAAAERAGR